MISPLHRVSSMRSALALFAFVVVPTWPADAVQDLGATVATAPMPALTASADGTLVLDTRARLAWARCVEGMRWNGRTCAGRPRLLTLAEARTLVRQYSQATGVRWRLPRVNELRRLVVRKGDTTSVDMTLFPNTPTGWHWTGTASVNTAPVNPYAYDNVMRGGRGADLLGVRRGWAVDTSSGTGRGDVDSATPLIVRLVRPAPDP